MVKRLKPKNAIIVVVTDSAMARAYIGVGVKKRSKNAATWKVKADVSAQIKGLVPKGCELRINKVKAHARDDGKRSYVNGVVDKMAHSEMLKARKGVA